MFTANHLHPLLVHFPIALIIFGFFAELAFLIFKKDVCLSKAGFYLMIAGTITAGVALTTGYLFTDEPTEGAIMAIHDLHETFAIITLCIMVVASVLRIYMVLKKKEDTGLKWIVFYLYLAGALSVMITGSYGGTMVYNYMIGI
jgi:uncharacterized membrane protein